MARGKGRKIRLVANICTEDHGGPNNSAEVYGHWGSSRTCVRLPGSDTWVFNVRKPEKKESK